MNKATNEISIQKKIDKARRKAMNQYEVYSRLKIGDELIYMSGKNKQIGVVTQKTGNAIYLGKECISRFHLIQEEIVALSINGYEL